MTRLRPTRAFTEDDQIAFARLSGDANPMHMDPLAARRTQAGRPVVHGVHILLWTLEQLAMEHTGVAAPDSLRVDFVNFLPVGARVEVGPLEQARNGRRTVVRADGSAVMTLGLETREGVTVPRRFPQGTGDRIEPTAAIERNLAQMVGLRGTVPYAAPDADVARAFPLAASWLGAGRLNALMACTRLVGMICPGLHSIFNRIEGVMTPPPVGDGLAFSVESVDERFRRVRLAVEGGAFSGLLTASARLPPIAQPTFVSLAAEVTPGAYASARALVVGGSRGLGELTAKVLAAGGADVVISYARGREDAERVSGEIRAGGGRCTVLQFDAEQAVPAQIGESLDGVTHCYYFATPMIFGANRLGFDSERFAGFVRIYVEAFEQLCAALQASAGERAVVCYYPSSAAVAERPPGMTEYAMAKAAGELLCQDMPRMHRALRIVSTRLPRLATDQTSTLSSDAGEPATRVMLDVVRQVQGAGGA